MKMIPTTSARGITGVVVARARVRTTIREIEMPEVIVVAELGQFCSANNWSATTIIDPCQLKSSKRLNLKLSCTLDVCVSSPKLRLVIS
ncbi:hypothetical protein TKK_0018230 [Trichogramma kaykai]